MDTRTESQHVVPYDDQWGVRAENSEKPSKLFNTRMLAIAYAFDIADNNDGKVVVHSKDGTIKSVKKTEETSKLAMLLAS